ncbi:MAG: putative glutamine amidotransferase [Thermoleophilaceae bacterium]|nr:putative glutamine amidotransferase [Thermoleophilaceae bacterium]
MTGRRPVIGMAVGAERVRWAAWDEVASVLPSSYAAADQRAGGLALLLPPDDQLVEGPDEILDLIDALLLASGNDIDPASYGTARAEETETVDTWRDRFEIALALRALERDMPLLAVCRGMQLLNVALGGTLVQNLPRDGRHRPTDADWAQHEVEVEPGTLAARAAGGGRVLVHSHHHQAVDRVGDGLRVSARADDGLVEALELPDRAFALGVLWHPEEDEHSAVIRALVDEARSRVSQGVA